MLLPVPPSVPVRLESFAAAQWVYVSTPRCPLLHRATFCRCPTWEPPAGRPRKHRPNDLLDIDAPETCSTPDRTGFPLAAPVPVVFTVHVFIHGGESPYTPWDCHYMPRTKTGPPGTTHHPWPFLSTMAVPASSYVWVSKDSLSPRAGSGGC